MHAAVRPCMLETGGHASLCTSRFGCRHARGALCTHTPYVPASANVSAERQHVCERHHRPRAEDNTRGAYSCEGVVAT